MALPVTFAGQTSGPVSQLDQNFAALGAIDTIPGVLAGSNAITFTAATNTPTVSAYVDGQSYGGTVVSDNTGATTFRYGALPPLPCYKDTATGPVALSGTELQSGNYALFRYDASLNGGTGGFHVISGGVAGGTVDVSGLSVGGGATIASIQSSLYSISFGTIASIATVEYSALSMAGVSFGDNFMVQPMTVVPANLTFYAYASAAGVPTVKAVNSAQTSASLAAIQFRLTAFKWA